MIEAACSEASTVAGESMAGTAPTVSRILIVEQPGPWPRKALESRALNPKLAAALHALDERDDTKVVLARRSDRKKLVDGRNVWSMVREGANVRAQHFVEPDLSAPVEFPSRINVQSPKLSKSLFVCTNGARDTCCAVKGRELIASLRVETWELSHIGGHRFAPTGLLFPAGLSLGRLSPETTEAALGDGPIDPATIRGRFGRTAWQQVAELTASAQEGIKLDGLDSVGAPEDTVVSQESGERWTFQLSSESCSQTISCGTEFDDTVHWRVAPQDDAAKERRRV